MPADKQAAAGRMPIKQLLETDWRNNYKQMGVPAEALAAIVTHEIQSGSQPVRLRNTLMLFRVDPQDPTHAVFHTFTADPYGVFASLVLRMLLSLVQARGVQVATTTLLNDGPYRLAKRLLGGEYVELTDGSEPNTKTMTLRIGDFYRQHAQGEVQ